MTTILTSGDIAIIGYNADNPDEFAFVPLINIISGTEINFTDNGWFASGSFRANEGTFTWIAPSDITAGTVINPTITSTQFALSTSGDQILAYQGLDSSPTFIYALNNEGAGVWQSDATSSNTSALPTGLINGETAVALDEIDNAVYTGITSGTQAELLAAISDKSNWSGSDSDRQTISTTPFTITDAGGGDSNINISATDAIKSEGDSGTNNFTFTVSRTDTTGFATVDYTVSSIIADNFDFVGNVFPSGTVNFADGVGSQVISIPVSGDTDPEADEDFTVTLSNPSDSFTLGTSTANGTIINDDFGITLISNVQGSGASSPLEGQTVTIEAVVVGDFQNGTFGTSGDLDGFFLQEEDADADANPLTSEGIFVFDGNSPVVNIAVGDLVQVTGEVAEFNGLTELTGVTVTVVSSGNSLPTPATVNFPVTAVDDLEAFEGMAVTIPDTLFVTEYFNLDRFGEVVLSSDGATNEAGTDGRLDQYTDFNAPSVTGFSNYLTEIEKRRILLDDGQTAQNPNPIIHGRGGNPLSATNTLRGGDTVTDLSGILSFGFDEYRIQPTAPIDFQPTNPRFPTPEDVGGTLKVASLNVLNFFTTLGDSGDGSGPNSLSPRGADNQAEFDRQLEKLVTTLATMDADVVGLLEVENEYQDLNGDGQIAIQTIVNALNNRVGAGTYAYVDPGTPSGDTGDAITVAAIYKTSAVQIADGTTVEFLTDADLPSLGLSGPIFDGVSTNRAPMAVTFEQLSNGETFTFSVNHFKSKGGTGTGDDADIGDGQGNFNGTRVRAAQAVTQWLATDPTGSGDNDFMIVGDLNSYAQEDPITTIESAGYTDLIEQFVGNDAYSFVFDGQFGYLDYALANDSLESQVTGVTEWHINADEPDAFDYNLDFGRDSTLFDGQTPYRTSDHDPVIVGLNLTSSPNEITGSNGSGTLVGTDGDDVITGLGGRDRIEGRAGNDIFVYTSLKDGIDTITDFEVGSDLIDVSAILDNVGYVGSNPIADSYLQITDRGGSSILRLDPDGVGSARAVTLALISDLPSSQLADIDNFIIPNPPVIIF